MNQLEAELIGLHLGDGTLYKTGRKTLVWELRGGLEEKEFYDTHISNLLQKIFPKTEFKMKFRSGGKNGCYGIQTTQKIITQFYLDNGFSPGKKVLTAKIPENIMKGNNINKIAVLRGLFDTDGCIRFQKINNEKSHKYPNIEWGLASKELAQNIQKLLLELGFRCNLHYNKYNKIAINGKKEVTRFFELIKPKNVKHLKRFKFWSINGYFIPKSILQHAAVA